MVRVRVARKRGPELIFHPLGGGGHAKMPKTRCGIIIRSDIYVLSEDSESATSPLSAPSHSSDSARTLDPVSTPKDLRLSARVRFWFRFNGCTSHAETGRASHATASCVVFLAPVISHHTCKFSAPAHVSSPESQNAVDRRIVGEPTLHGSATTCPAV